MAEPVLRETVSTGPVPRRELPGWRERWGVVAGITTRGAPDAPFDLGLRDNPPAGAGRGRWHQLLQSLPPFRGIVVSHQVHGVSLSWQADADGLKILAGLDGHATASPGVLLAVTVADCVPVYLVDPVRRAVALLHAGWRGTAAGILEQGVRCLAEHGSRPDDLVFHAGVSICGACYRVGPEVLSACGVPSEAGGGGPLDLRARLASQARDLGLRHRTSSPWCTAHDRTQFFSHRASAGTDGRLVAYLGLAP